MKEKHKCGECRFRHNKTELCLKQKFVCYVGKDVCACEKFVMDQKRGAK